MEKLAVIYGTRPEFLKIYPILLEAERLGVDFISINTGQHSSILTEMESIFNFVPDYRLSIQTFGLNSSELLSRLILEIGNVVKAENITSIISQGDTFTVMASGVVSFLEKMKFYHVEAGLRTGDINFPFPEEFNRRVVSLIASKHFAPTNKSKENLLAEGVEDKNVIVSGNTIIDMLKFVLDRESIVIKRENKVLITAHRRENIGERLDSICSAVMELAIENQNIIFYWSLHPNPLVKEFVVNKVNNLYGNIIFLEPLNYLDNVRLMAECLLIISDSGGIQEEAPTLGKKVLILRNETERPEVIDCGCGVLVGSDIAKIKAAFYNELNNNVISNFDNPFGNGQSAKIIVKSIIDD